MVLKKFNLARRYLWGSLLAALVPLLVIAFFYDRYSTSLLNNLISSKIESNIERFAARTANFVSVQTNRLENIVDLPDTAAYFKGQNQHVLSGQLRDFLLLEVSDPDLYAIEFSDIDGKLLQTVPSTAVRGNLKNYTTLPQITLGEVEIIGPVLPGSSRPGWFLVRMPVIVNQERVGFVSLRMRLASLTEQFSSLVEPNVYEPQLVVFDRIFLTSVGTVADKGKTIARSRQIFPGWRIHLIARNGELHEPRTKIRYTLLVVAALSCFGLVWLFLLMSRRLSRQLQPLNEGARAISNGDFSIVVPEKGPGELGSLARSFNRMREQLGDLIKSRVDAERRATLGDLAAGIAHEVRNPLATVVATLHGLKRGEKDIQREEMYELISGEISRVDQTITEFLKYTRPTPPSSELVEIKELFSSIRTLTAATLHEHQLTLSLLGDLTLKLEIDPAHIRQILLNLILNAAQATPEGGHISLRAVKKGYQIEMSISDNGKGMDAYTQSKVTRPFYTTRNGGTGLGLPVTGQLVESNSGTMRIKSIAGQGTTVTLCFPVHPPEAH